GDEIKVYVKDQYQNPLMDQSIKMTEDEPHPIELVVRSTPRLLRGAIRDHQDRPLQGAEVTMGGGFMQTFSGRSDAGGNVEFAEVFADQGPISVSAPGHVSKTVTVDVGEKPFDIRLERARDLVLELTGPMNPKQRVHVTFKAD